MADDTPNLPSPPAPTASTSVTVYMAEHYGMLPAAFEATMRATVFKEGSREELAAFLLVAKEYQLNPLTKEVYAFKAKGGGIVPVVSIDGWVSLCNRHPQFDGMTFDDIHDAEGKLYAITCTMYRKDRNHPTVVTEYLEECRRNTDPWKMEHRMLRHKAMIQAARYSFGFSGIHDEDEAERITVSAVHEAQPSLTAGMDATTPKKRAGKGKETAEATTPAADPSEAAHAGQAGPGEGDAHEEVHDAEFTDGAPEGEPERPTATASAPDAATGPGSSDSATDASGASAAETSSQDATESRSDAGKPAETRAPAGELYCLASDQPDDAGRVPTYKDGAPFSKVKTDAKAKPPTFDLHPVEADDEDEDEEHADGPDAASQAEDAADAAAGDVPPPTNALLVGISAIGETKNYLAAKQVLKTLAGSAEWKAADEPAKAQVRQKLWEHYEHLRDSGQESMAPHEDFTLMRTFLEFGAASHRDIDAAWKPFYRGVFKGAVEGDQQAILALMMARKEALPA